MAPPAALLSGSAGCALNRSGGPCSPSDGRHLHAGTHFAGTRASQLVVNDAVGTLSAARSGTSRPVVLITRVPRGFTTRLPRTLGQEASDGGEGLSGVQRGRGVEEESLGDARGVGRRVGVGRRGSWRVDRGGGRVGNRWRGWRSDRRRGVRGRGSRGGNNNVAARKISGSGVDVALGSDSGESTVVLGVVKRTGGSGHPLGARLVESVPVDDAVGVVERQGLRVAARVDNRVLRNIRKRESVGRGRDDNVGALSVKFDGWVHV